MLPQSPPQNEMVTAPFTANGRELHSGMKVWAAKPSPNSTWQIIGGDYSQVLEVDIHPDEVVTCEPGTMAYMDPNLLPRTDMGSFEQACKRCCCAGEGFFRLHFQNETDEVLQLGLTPKFPAVIVPVDLSKYDGMVFNRGAFMAALGSDWRVDIRRVRGGSAICCAGQGLFMNTLHGSGMVFLNAGGTVLTKQLEEEEELVVEQHAVLAFERTVELSARSVGNCLTCCCGGMGLFNAVLTGPGFVMIHSMGLSRLSMALAVKSGGGGGGGDGGGDA
mmetsp:Transcript_90811/g.211272  ORF Transcript_90811/g.211272 Transcript_90811/m.211272 type:complete len:276 (-) Transcript_90811:214-1041(-)